MKQPPSFVYSTLPSHLCWLHKLLYGLKQALRAWYTRLSDFLLSIGFLASKVDNSLCILSDGTNIFYLLVYVDDILLTSNNFAMLHCLIQLLSSEFKLHYLGTVHYFLVLKFSLQVWVWCYVSTNMFLTSSLALVWLPTNLLIL